MNTATDSADLPVVPRATPRRDAIRTFTWLLRRELWENRGVWIAPLVCAAILVGGTIFGGVSFGPMGGKVFMQGDADVGLNMPPPQILAALTLVGIAVPFYITVLFTQFFYAMSSLYDDRRDRSVLFWKSLPVSDLETVLSKLVVALLVIPLIAAAVAVLTQLVVAVVAAMKVGGIAAQLAAAGPAGAKAAAAIGGLGGALADPALWGMNLVIMVYATLTFALWTLPVIGWVMFVSAWAPRAPFLWVTMPLLAIGLAERVAFHSTYFLRTVADHTWGFLGGAFAGGFNDDKKLDAMLEAGATAPQMLAAVMTPSALFTNPELWVGVVVGAGFIAAAVWARRYRDENT